MKRIVLTLACILAAGAAYPAERLDVSVSGWYPFDSSYNEYPSPTTADQSYIWGKFDNVYGNVDFKLRLYRGLFLFGGFRYGVILPNLMYLNSLANSLTIGGSLWGFHADVAYRLIEDENATLDAYAGFLFGDGMKKFYDYTVSGTVVTPGNFGFYSIQLFGPEIGVSGAIKSSIGIGFAADFNVSPYYENATAVSGWTPELIEESAKGWRYKLEAALTYTVSKAYFELGAAYEMIHYNYGDYATHDLTIRYAGPFLRAGMKI